MIGSRSNPSKKKGSRVPFPKRLFQLLKLVEEKGWEQTVSWVDDGTGFKVHDREQFEKDLLSKYFVTKRYASFARQLHAYGFDCVRTGRQTGIYSHPDFNRNDPIASCSLKRDVCKTISKTAISKHSQQKQKDKLQFSNFELGIRAGDAMIVQFPSLLAPKIQDAESPLKVTPTLSSESSGILAGLFDTVRAQVADRKREAFRRITSDASDSRFNHADDSCSYPSGSSNTKNYTRTVGAFEDMKTATENPFKTNTFKCNPDKAFLSRSSAPSASRHSRVGSGVSGTSSSDTTRSTTSKRATELFAHYYNTKKTVKTIRNDTSATSTNVTNTNKSATDLFAQHTTNAAKMVQDNTFDRMALVREDDDGISLQDDDSFGPLPSGSPLRTSYDIEEQVSVLPNQFDSSLEPRPIGEMVQQPSCLENSIIAVIKPQKQVPV